MFFNSLTYIFLELFAKKRKTDTKLLFIIIKYEVINKYYPHLNHVVMFV